MKEKWKPFRHGYYEISNFGRVWSIRSCKVLKYENANGYLTIQTCIDRRKKHHYIHELVARKFIGPRPEGKEVNHKDLNKLNPLVTNLEYKTRKENLYHALENGVDMLFARTRSTGHLGAVLSVYDLKKIKKMYATGEYYQKELAKKFKVSPAHISSVVCGVYDHQL